MNISQENIDDLNAIINIELTPEDYKSQVDSVIKSQAKKAKLPGFRPGMVPASHIRRTYGKAILIDEINKIVGDSLNNFISENKLEILGQPLPKEEEGKEYAWDFTEDFKFQYEIGLAPKVEVPFSDKDTLTEYTIKADEETLNSRVSNLRKSYGKRSNPEVSEENDVIYGELKQVDDKNEVIEGGLTKTASLRTDIIDVKKIKKSLVGLKKGDTVVIDLKKAYDNSTVARILEIEEDQVEALGSLFQLTVENVNRLEEAELDQEFFNKIYGEDEVKTEEEFRARVTKEIEEMFVQNADQKLQNDLYTLGMDRVKADFPDEFLKRWLKATNEKLTDEEIQEGYDDFAKNLRWTLIENKIINDNELEIKYEEVVATAKERLLAQFKMYGQQELPEEQLNQYAMQLLQDKEQANRLFEEVKALKVFDYLKGLVKIEKKDIPYNKFLELK
ncbi:trigger factor [Albibacterium sp.]|uniref:trigger factor n=1 Tax=Albibacterium sp. TaxID=2952885 RepID=UPI002C1D2EEF|nr:trigger factor [Albibacterium sp.]HUH18087.1 trigger factor [Albibacterium sp.]